MGVASVVMWGVCGFSGNLGKVSGCDFSGNLGKVSGCDFSGNLGKEWVWLQW